VQPATPSEALEGFAEVSTKSLSSYIDHNLSEMEGAEPSALTIADPEMINLAEELTVGPFSRVRMKAFGRWVTAPLICSVLTAGACWFVWGRQPRAGAQMPTVAVVAPVAAAVAPPVPVTPAAPAPALAPPPAAAPAPAAAAVAAHVPVAAPAPAPAAVPAATPAPAPVTTASGRQCRARISSRPSGASVMLGERSLGHTPLETGEVPCGTSFTLVRPRYSPAAATVTESGGSPAALFVKLNRPAAQLVLTSTPANAQFRVNRSVIGQAPQSVSVPRYEKVVIEATLPDFRKWQKTVYVTAASMPINAALAPAR
jgi:hypothetical protein